MKCRHFVVCIMLLGGLSAPMCIVSPQAGIQDAGSQQSAPQAQSAEKDDAERGYAAFYSESLEGQKTACGGIYNSTQLTAAHPKLRCGTRLRVTNLRNGRTVRVTVNDRGPQSHNRIIDLSYAAARRLDFIQQGTTLVKVEVIR